MSETEHEVPDGHEQIDEAGRNATQQRMDEDGVENVPVADEVAEDEPWAS